MKHTVLALAIALTMSTALAAQAPKPSLPDPVKFVNKMDIVWNAVRSVFREMEFAIELEDRPGGRIVTRPHEFISGALTSSEVDKVAVKNDTVTGHWVKARYSVEAILEIVKPTETMVTIRTNMEGLRRELDGSEAWVPLQSVGTFEKRILGKISLRLLGNEMLFDEKKGFWDKSPQPVDSRRPKPMPTRPPI